MTTPTRAPRRPRRTGGGATTTPRPGRTTGTTRGRRSCPGPTPSGRRATRPTRAGRRPRPSRAHCLEAHSACASTAAPSSRPTPNRRRSRPATAAPARAGLPQGAAHAAARRVREGPVRAVETVTTVRTLAQPVVGHGGSRPSSPLVHAAGLPPVVDVDVRERADCGRVIHLRRRARAGTRRARAASPLIPISTGVGHESCMPVPASSSPT